MSTENPDQENQPGKEDQQEKKYSWEQPEEDLGTKISNGMQTARDTTVNAFNKFKRIVSPITWTACKIGNGLKWAAFERENGETKFNDSGLPVFSPVRLAKVFSGAAAGAVALKIAWHAAFFYGTSFEELVYTTGKQEIETGELYQFTGCTSLPCSTEARNGKFYEIESSIIFPTLFYPEEDVYANIPQQDGACYVKGHGIYLRDFRHLHTKFNWYQKVHDISCRPYTDEERETAIGSGAIAQPKEIMP